MLNLRGTQLQPAISGGILSRHSWTEDEYGDEIGFHGEEMIYGMLELRRKWSSTGANRGATLYSGIGLNWYEYHSHDYDRGSDEGISFIFQAGAQIQAKLPILPTLVGDVSMIYTPAYGASFLVSYGAQGSFLQLVSVWGSIFLFIIAVGGV